MITGKPGTPHDGAMIALLPSDEHCDLLHADGGEGPDELHLTLYYLGDGADFATHLRQSIVNAIESMVQRRQLTSPLGRTFGVNHWNPDSDEPSMVLAVGDHTDGENLGTYRDMIGNEALYDGAVQFTMPEQHTPWVPHICLAYTDDTSMVESLADRSGQDVKFDHVRVAFSGVNYDIPFIDTMSPEAIGGSEMTTEVEPSVAGDVAMDDSAAWEGVLTMEGVETGDGRQFQPGSLTWADMPLPLRWQKETAHGGQNDVTVDVGRIDSVERRGAEIWGQGVLDLANPDGAEAQRRMAAGMLWGNSVDVDSVKDADVELVFPTSDNSEGDVGFEELFASPELTIFHKGRIRATTLVSLPAFAEAKLSLAGGTGSPSPSGVGYAVETHVTATSDGPWNGPMHSARIPTKVSVDLLSQMYGHVDGLSGTAQFLHHEVNCDGSPGPANLTACASGIAVLNARMNSFTANPSDRLAVYNHLAAHLHSAGQMPPPLEEVIVDPALTACADYPTPPSEWFTNPQLTGPTNLTITDNGRIFGHAATWGMCHTGFANTCTTPPREGDHSYFHLGEVKTNDGQFIGVGQITLGTGHAPVFGIDAQEAASHYDHTGSAVADVTSGEDDHGIWVAGAIRNGTPVARVQELRAAKLSGDWRRIGGKLRLVALLAVNVPGFPVARVRTHAIEGQQRSLVAAGVVAVEARTDNAALKTVAANLAKRIGRDPVSQAKALRARLGRS